MNDILREELTLVSATNALSNSLTMVGMSRDEYAGIEGINVTMTGYTCDAEDIDINTAWESVKGHYGL